MVLEFLLGNSEQVRDFVLHLPPEVQPPVAHVLAVLPQEHPVDPLSRATRELGLPYSVQQFDDDVVGS